jgi:RND family efflux transporter MFP subunit
MTFLSDGPERKAASPRLLITTAGVALLTIAAVLWFAWPRAEELPAPEMPERGALHLSAAQMQAAGITVEPIRKGPLAHLIRAPGEVQSNAYTTSVVAPRVPATVIGRSAMLGDAVRKGQALVTLYSEDMAEAQGALLLAQRNLDRVQRLKDVVAGREIEEATVQRQQALGRLESYGLTPAQIAALAGKGLDNAAIGQFTLTAPRDGTITRDEFHAGDVVEAGALLFEIAQLGDVWVEAHVSPALLPQVTGDTARVQSGTLAREARIVQRRETVDEATRTVGIRLAIDNADRAFTPGAFVDVELRGAPQEVLSLPTEAVLRDASGAWVVFAEDGTGALDARPVTPLFVSGGRTAIAGIAEGTRVVTNGAFFVMSEASKASFGEEE